MLTLSTLHVAIVPRLPVSYSSLPVLPRLMDFDIRWLNFSRVLVTCNYGRRDYQLSYFYCSDWTCRLLLIFTFPKYGANPGEAGQYVQLHFCHPDANVEAHLPQEPAARVSIFASYCCTRISSYWCTRISWLNRWQLMTWPVCLKCWFDLFQCWPTCLGASPFTSICHPSLTIQEYSLTYDAISDWSLLSNFIRSVLLLAPTNMCHCLNICWMPAKCG